MARVVPFLVPTYILGVPEDEALNALKTYLRFGEQHKTSSDAVPQFEDDTLAFELEAMIQTLQ